MSGVDIAGLVERLRDERHCNDWYLRQEAADALLAQAAEMAEARGQIAQLVEDRARFPDRPDGIGRMIQAHIGNLKAGKDAATEHAHRALDRAVDATRQRDEALAVLKASEEREAGLREALKPFGALADAYFYRYETRPGEFRESHENDPDERAVYGINRVEITTGDFRRARSVLENGSAALADATNNPPSDPGTEQREAGL